MLKSGREEAAEIVHLQYRLFDSLYTKRITELTQLTEHLKSLGLSATEASRIRQFERYIGESVEGLRMIKMYRTPQALRAFGRLFTVILPPLYAASFSQLAFDLQSLPMGIVFALITPLCLTALFESMTNLEDPFVGYLTLDGIDCYEELMVLHWHQLKNARSQIYPHAKDFEFRHITHDIYLVPPEDGHIFDVSLLRGTNGLPSDSGYNAVMGDSNRISRFGGSNGSGSYRAEKTSIGASGGDASMCLDGSDRVSHYAMDASARSTRLDSKRDLKK